jgi:hypothetical protein
LTVKLQRFFACRPSGRLRLAGEFREKADRFCQSKSRTPDLKTNYLS